MLSVSKYWLFQIMGWFSFALFNIYIAVITQELTGEVLLINLLISFIGFFLSHLFRNFILKHRLSLLTTEKLLLPVIIGITILSIIYTIVYYIIKFFLYHELARDFKFADLLGSFVAMFFLFSIWNYIYFAWTYLENNRRNLINRLKMESAMKDLELKTIRSNLQPHFIFNSLNSIRALIDEDPDLARNAITHISNILRSSITKQEVTDTLENELTLVDDYLALEKIRFEERLSYRKNIATNSLPIKIPTMMLQTLVENAIKHGISKLENGGLIEINASYENNLLQIEIINTGILDTAPEKEDSLGFGLHASRHRLKLIYQDQAHFEIFEKDSKVHVVIKIKTTPS